MIKGEIKYGKYDLYLELDLYLPKPKKNKSSIVVNNYEYAFMKLKNPIDIISSSLCGMNNLLILAIIIVLNLVKTIATIQKICYYFD